ncbi:hypothetical protein EJ08DRAFT_194522 [Tothia fuscella]|uniref:Uncharacterized protein n=1 Tax=Tothia fuscella TaxID=1048955 RepID=A0A9P4TYB6_9PEZI|nr:hypothetical protein EJ08DRAFT_194522 [Tothia fuscella]
MDSMKSQQKPQRPREAKRKPNAQDNTAQPSLDDGRTQAENLNKKHHKKKKYRKPKSSTEKQALVVPNQSRHTSKKANTVFPFLSLPREIRDQIYDQGLDFDGVDRAIEKCNDRFKNRRHRQNYQTTDLNKVFNVKTPTLLLLNHQIYEEAQQILQKKKLVLSSPPTATFKDTFIPLVGFWQFISPGTLEHVHAIDLTLSIGPIKPGPGNMIRWRGGENFKSEIYHATAWFSLLKRCVAAWMIRVEPGSLRITIAGSEHQEDAVYTIPGTQDKLSSLDRCLEHSLKSQDMNELIGFLTFASSIDE